MIIKNYLQQEGQLESAHQGQGQVENVKLFTEEEFETKLKFLIYTELEPGNSIGEHKHGENEEIYIILSGNGVMTVNSQHQEVKEGDVILNKPGWSHALQNTSDQVLKILVFEVDK